MYTKIKSCLRVRMWIIKVKKEKPPYLAGCVRRGSGTTQIKRKKNTLPQLEREGLALSSGISTGVQHWCWCWCWRWCWCWC
ncbi:hypothetical protein L208DRAFT_912110 [Tricholoma matsutake]|nr:hypothetical protein L208DRAFT_912110 [Tricholoma matsutake 945]